VVEACNRGYYARIDAAQATWHWADVPVNPAEIKTHRGLIAALGKHVVKAGLLAAEFGKAFNQVERIRLLADYTGEEVDAEKAHWAVQQAEAFVAAVQRTLAARKLTTRNDSDPFSL
jgi:uncharacterized protein (UPF0332 family)